MPGDPRDPPGAARDRTMAVAEMKELEDIIIGRTSSAWCQRAHARPCPCWRCAALRIIRYGVQN